MKGNGGKILAGLVIVIVLAVVFLRGDQLEELVRTVREGTPLFLMAAVAFQLGKYFAQGGEFVWCFRSVGADLRYREGLKLVFGTFFVNTVAPSLNLAGTTLVVDDSGKRGVPAGKATGAALLMQLSIDTGFVIIMLVGFGVLTFTVGLQPGWLLLGLAAIALVGGLVAVMTLGGTHPDLVLKVERLVDKVAHRFKKGPIDPWAERTVESFSKAAGLMVAHPATTVRPFLFAILSSTCELGCFAMVGMAFGIHDIQALICGYVVATLFAMISFTPQGVGVVEAAVLVAFTLFGIEQATGMAAVMVYRGIVFWLPFLIGAVVIQRMKAFVGKGNGRADGAKGPDGSAKGTGKASLPATQPPAKNRSEAAVASPSPAAEDGAEAAPAGKPAS